MLEEIKEILSEEAGVDVENVTEATTFEELDIDSLDLMQVIMEVETKYDITVEEKGGLKTVGDLISYIKAQQA